ncbi:acid phosphatase type 7-like isoform X1 [Lineus longissimus]|uniref:acid phosphatase type 7-like isoform X1 n=1 Tax=Lineus longissimus TaxID=88925 RepID=UPI002B4D6470
MCIRGEMLVILAVVLVVGLIAQIQAVDFYQPEQIHMSYGADPTQMTFTWVTFDNTSVAIVQYGVKSFEDYTAKGIIEKFVDGGAAKRVIYMYRVNATMLTPGQTYRYRVGSPLGWSTMFTFTAMKSGTNWSPRFALYGDMGNKNAQSMARLQTEAEEGNVDFIVHAGDYAYNMDNENATRGDEFMRQIEPIAANVPYMTCVGNHEYAYNFSNYKYRFTMPRAGGEGRGLWYSFDVGPIHFIAWDTELYYYTNYGKQQIYNQYKWLEQDLIEANKNRDKRPWIITFGHRPMYCSNNKGDNFEHCQNPENYVRVGDPTQKPGWPSPEDLFYKYGVDLEIAAHEHDYERMWPVFNMRVCNGSTKYPYTNPTAPVHIVTGSAGSQEGVDPFFTIPWPWSALRTTDYGYNRVKVVNSTHLYFEYVSDVQGGRVMDSIWYIKDKHGPGLYTCHLGMDQDYHKNKVKEFEKIRDDFNGKFKGKQQKKKSKRIPLMRLLQPARPIEHERL